MSEIRLPKSEKTGEEMIQVMHRMSLPHLEKVRDACETVRQFFALMGYDTDGPLVKMLMTLNNFIYLRRQAEGVDATDEE